MRRNQGKKGEKKRKEKLAIGAPPNIHCWLASSQKKVPLRRIQWNQGRPLSEPTIHLMPPQGHEPLFTCWLIKYMGHIFSLSFLLFSHARIARFARIAITIYHFT
jgi:hypothetical protein